MGLLSWLFGATKKPKPKLNLTDAKSIAVDGPVLGQPLVESKVTAKNPNSKPVNADFNFLIEHVNIEELAHVTVGETVNFWATKEEPTRITVYGRSGQGDRLGNVPISYAKIISDHRSLNLSIETEVIEKTLSSCTIACRLVSNDEMNIKKKEQQDNLRDKLIKSYKPRKSISADFSFSIKKMNIEELSLVIVGDRVNLWASPDAPTKIVIFRRGSIGGQGRLGVVPGSHAKLIAEHRSLSLPIETEVIEKSSSSCTIACRLVSNEEVGIKKKDQQDKLRDDLNKPYRPTKPLEFSLHTKSNALKVGEQLQFVRLPSIEECVSDISSVVLVMSSMDGVKIFEKSDDAAIKVKLVRLVRTFNSIRIIVSSKSNQIQSHEAEFKIQVVPIEP